MQCHVFKPSRRKGSKAVKARMYSGRYKLSWMLRTVTVALRTPDKGIAQRDLKRMIDVAERERRVIRSLDELPGTGSQSIEDSLQRFQQDLRAKRRSEKYVADVRRRVSAIRVGRVGARCSRSTWRVFRAGEARTSRKLPRL